MTDAGTDELVSAPLDLPWRIRIRTRRGLPAVLRFSTVTRALGVLAQLSDTGSRVTVVDDAGTTVGLLVGSDTVVVLDDLCRQAGVRAADLLREVAEDGDPLDWSDVPTGGTA